MTKSLNRLFFSSPYAGVPWAFFVYFVFIHLLSPLDPIYTQQLNDPDDYMRMDEVIRWLQGQSWYDLSVPRMSPGAHTIIHWSRLVDLPIAFFTIPFTLLMDMRHAVMAASFIVPPLWFAVLLKLIPPLTQPLVGKDRANLSCLILLFFPLILFNYAPGRVGHHSLQIIIAGFGLLSLIKILKNEDAIFYAIGSSFAFACSFWIGAEGLPWIILFITCLGLMAAFEGGKIARTSAIFGFFLPLFTACFIPLALPATEFGSHALSWFSPAYALFAGLSGAIFIVGYLLDPSSRHTRIALYACLGLGAAFVFFKLIPSALSGPFADYDTFDATVALDNITEAMPLMDALHFNPLMPITFFPVAAAFMHWVFLALVAFLTSLWFAVQTKGKNRLVWLVYCAYLVGALLLTLFWQKRVGFFLELFAIAPLAYVFCLAFESIKKSRGDKILMWKKVCLFMLLGPLPVFFMPALLLQFHLPSTPKLTCPSSAYPMWGALSFLNQSPGLGETPLTIMNASDLGPQILFATRHRVIAGNFNVPGNIDAYSFFHATDDKKARQMLQKWGADLVMTCRIAPMLYLGKDYYALSHSTLKMGKDGMLHLTNTDKDQPLIQRLIDGQIPPWLSPIEIPSSKDYLLFRVQNPEG